jgi:hypothetical protein
MRVIFSTRWTSDVVCRCVITGGCRHVRNQFLCGLESQGLNFVTNCIRSAAEEVSYTMPQLTLNQVTWPNFSHTVLNQPRQRHVTVFVYGIESQQYWLSTCIGLFCYFSSPSYRSFDCIISSVGRLSWFSYPSQCMRFLLPRDSE